MNRGLLAFLSVNLISVSAFAKTAENKIVYDYGHGALLVYGVYSPDAASKKTGLEAEIEARKEGVKLASEHVSSTCKDEPKAPDANGSWRNSLKSLGSTIYPKGILEIELHVPLRDVFTSIKTSNVQIPKSAEGDDIAFKMPWLPAKATHCASVKIAADSKTSFDVLPVNISKSTQFKTVTLTLASDLSLQPATPADALLLKNSNFAKLVNDKQKGTVEAPLIVPVFNTGKLD